MRLSSPNPPPFPLLPCNQVRRNVCLRTDVQVDVAVQMNGVRGDGQAGQRQRNATDGNASGYEGTVTACPATTRYSVTGLGSMQGTALLVAELRAQARRNET